MVRVRRQVRQCRNTATTSDTYKYKPHITVPTNAPNTRVPTPDVAVVRILLHLSCLLCVVVDVVDGGAPRCNPVGTSFLVTGAQRRNCSAGLRTTAQPASINVNGTHTHTLQWSVRSDDIVHTTAPTTCGYFKQCQHITCERDVARRTHQLKQTKNVRTKHRKLQF